jgi:DNA-directed RNA polymerase subunit RPC12/RpoP
MTRKDKCSNCGRWFYNDNGLMIYRPDTYDSSMCPNCNDKIDREISINGSMNKYNSDKEILKRLEE